MTNDNPSQHLIDPEKEKSDELKFQSVEQIINYIGGKNRYQIIVLTVFLFQWMVSVFVIIGPLFFLTEPQFLCKNSDGEYEICNEKQGCDNGILDTNQRQTMSLSFGLYCKYKNFRGYESAATFFGSIFGNFIIAYLAEVQGRKTALLYSWGIATIGFIGIIFSFDKYSLMLCNFITGFGIVPSNSLNLVIINEQSNDHFRQKATTAILFSWAGFQIVLTICAYYIWHWRQVYIYVLVLPAIAAMAGMFYVQESPSFVIQKQFQMSSEICNKIANLNGKKINLNQRNFEYLTPHEGVSKKYGYLDLFKLKSLRYITIACASSMFMSQFIYYVTEYSLDNIGNSTYINGIIIAFGELFSQVCISYFIEKIPRKKAIIIFMAICNILCLLSFFIDNKSKKNGNALLGNLQTINSAFIRIFTAFCNTVSSVFVEELYPSPTRSLGVGFQMGVGIMGSTLASLATQFFKNIGWSQMGGVGLLIIPLNFFNIMYKETKGQKLQQEVEENRKSVPSILMENPYKLK